MRFINPQVKQINVENKKSKASIQYFLGKDFDIRIYIFMIKHQIIIPEHYIVNTLIYLFLSFFKSSANTVKQSLEPILAPKV